MRTGRSFGAEGAGDPCARGCGSGPSESGLIDLERQESVAASVQWCRPDCRCHQLFLNRTLHDCELLIQDNASTDTTGKISQGFAAETTGSAMSGKNSPRCGPLYGAGSLHPAERRRFDARSACRHRRRRCQRDPDHGRVRAVGLGRCRHRRGREPVIGSRRGCRALTLPTCLRSRLPALVPRVADMPGFEMSISSLEKAVALVHQSCQ